MATASDDDTPATHGGDEGRYDGDIPVDGDDIVIVGSGFGGLSTACYLADAGANVTVVEKNEQLGGRASQLQAEGFTFDMGPSWYLMPDVFERFFGHFGKQPSDYYELSRLIHTIGSSSRMAIRWIWCPILKRTRRSLRDTSPARAMR